MLPTVAVSPEEPPGSEASDWAGRLVMGAVYGPDERDRAIE